jgi:predicted transcriptional regulator
MAASSTNLHLLDSNVARELDLASELFHRINRVIPIDQTILSVLPSCLARDAVELMRKHGYSQVPVVQNNVVLGVFSYRSFAQKAAKAELDVWTKQRCAPGDLPVDEFLEQFRFASVKDEMTGVFDAMDKDNGVLIGAPERLIGVLTPMDFLRYLDRVASPFMLLSEIELALRTLIRLCLPNEQIAEAARPMEK